MNKTLIIVFCLFLSAVLGVFVVLPKYRLLQSEKAEAVVEGQSLANTESYYQNLNSINNQLQQYSDQLSKIDMALPQGNSIPQTFYFFQNEVSESGMVLKNLGQISNAPSASHPGLQKYSMTLSVSGPYSVFKSFLQNLEQSARMVQVQEISFSSPSSTQNASGSLEADLSVAFYSY